MIPTAFVPARPRVRRKRGRAGPITPLAGAPVLVAAEYLASTWVRLTFDRPVIPGAGTLPANQLLVDDAPLQVLLVGGEVTVLGPVRLEVSLAVLGPGIAIETKLSATAATGIVSAYDAAPWAGAEVVLPFP